ncbi:hypothetical protein ACRE_018320 [Hapsidospora chrysogenum ATCC 11550]|uniref:MARVEL domain-containing protein n=1 Tax=Hapsidospora chrysogenum (strain ATCC 11550 / CBS 779.69 / DSM 880 / IAM 14645 / JCM 23072 / IMI 49137) TaxID=857340 RepID=A0A086TDH3_HAPC1|nr:hypothetical protein ACRE_018320 [Hapsidospora chrysogenum ATCC 11550]
MFFFAVFFVSNRIGQITFLIPIVGMLAWFVDGFTKANSLTPPSILVLFIVSTIALAWTIFTLFSYHRSSNNARFVALVDAAFFGAFIASVYYLRGIASANCTDVTVSSSDWTVQLGDIRVTGPGADISWRTDKRCSMLKACFAFAIIEIVQFFVTMITAWLHGDSAEPEYYDDRRSRHSHSSRHSHRRRSHSGSRHSHHSHRRSYV